MKKLFTLLALLVVAMGASAQWTVVTHNDQPQGYTNILASLEVSNGSAVYGGNYTIGVFVGDECRLVVQDNDASVLKNQNGTRFLQFQVPGNYGSVSDEGKTITFKLSNANQDVFELTASTAITFRSDGDTYGYPPSSGLVRLTATLPTQITFNPFEVEVGKTVNLLDQIVVTPTGAQLPENYTWDLGNSEEFASIEDDVLTGVKVTADPALISMVSKDGNHGILAETTFTVIQHATAINIENATFDVYKNDEGELTYFMLNNGNNKAYSLVPVTATDEVLWEIEDATYIQTNQGSWTPIKGGTTRIRPYIVKADNSRLYPVSPAWITVNIIVPITETAFRWGADDVTPTEDVTFKCNVGDDIYQRLAERVVILPDDVADKTFTISEVDNSLFTIAANSVVANEAGTTTIAITPNGIDGDRWPIFVTVQVFNPAKTIAATTDPLVIDSKTSLANAGDAIAGNITYGPQNTSPRGTVTTQAGGVFTGEGGLTVNGVYFTITSPTDALVSGETTVSATLRWNDYSNYDGTDATIVEQTASVQFVVNITDAIDHFTITITPDANDPTTGKITLTPVPATATFSWDDFTLDAFNSEFGEWDVLDIANTGNGTYSYVASLPGEWVVTVQSNGQIVGNETAMLTAPAKVSLQSGWQWRSNNWGGLTGEQLPDFFGNDLVEARTYSDLLYNDPSWGFWGSMMDSNPDLQLFGGIAQNQMYKVKMGAAKDSYLYTGNVNEIVYLELVPGWNWVGSPYFYDRTIEHAFANTDLADGVVIVSKADGSVELSDGEWTGTLKMIKKGQGYYIYNPGSENMYCSFAMETYGGMEQGDETAAGARAMSRSVWHYDHTQFAGNMTMVASLADVENPEDYTIGAFVGDECRGEGSFDRGLAFITVHTDGGEEVTFRLHNELTGEYFDIDQTVTSTMRLGSVKAPVQLTSSNVVTGIATVERSAFNAESYDLNGRAVNGHAKGVTIRKMQDGTMKKVVRK